MNLLDMTHWSRIQKLQELLREQEQKERENLERDIINLCSKQNLKEEEKKIQKTYKKNI